MKIVITDYPETLKRNLTLEKNIIRQGLPDAEIVEYVYNGDKEELKSVLSDCVAVKTAFVMIDKEIIKGCPYMKCISFNSSGYNFVDYDYATKNEIGITAIGEYCTNEVADHTLSLILALNRGLKTYTKSIETDHLWQYKAVSSMPALYGKSIAIMGYGKIGKAVAKRAKAFGMRILAYDPYVPDEMIISDGAVPSSLNDIFENADIISNHMLQTKENIDFYSKKFFRSLKKSPLFINVARGGCVDETALLNAIKLGQVSGAGLDVFKTENPDIQSNEFIGLENVICTPHAAFYSNESLLKLQ